MANFEFSTLLETIYNVRYPVAVQLLPKILQFKSKIYLSQEVMVLKYRYVYDLYFL
jgi:hypothetical protein